MYNVTLNPFRELLTSVKQTCILAPEIYNTKMRHHVFPSMHFIKVCFNQDKDLFYINRTIFNTGIIRVFQITILWKCNVEIHALPILTNKEMILKPQNNTFETNSLSVKH